MANPGVIDYTHMDNQAGMDIIQNNQRVRATPSNPLGVNYLDGIGTPISLNVSANQTLTAAQLLTGVITVKSSAAINVAFDTAANIVAAVNSNTAGAVVGDYISVLLVNGASATGTLTLVTSTGVTYDANQANSTIPVGTSRYVLIRLTNVTPGSEACVVYL